MLQLLHSLFKVSRFVNCWYVCMRYFSEQFSKLDSAISFCSVCLCASRCNIVELKDGLELTHEDNL